MTVTGFFETVESRFHDWRYDHPRILYSLVRSLKPKTIVEVGSYRGYCACYLARALQENNDGRLYCIDNWSLTEHVSKYGNPRAHFEENLRACGVRDWVYVIEGNSENVQWPDQVDFAYIDGWHSHRMASHDFGRARSLGATLIAMDDTENCAGPRMFSDEFSDPEWQRIHIPSDNGLDLFIKISQKRPVTFSQELPLPNPGTDIRPMTLDQQCDHFRTASLSTGLDYSRILDHTQHA